MDPTDVLVISEACDKLARTVAKVILRNTDYDPAMVREVVSAELFMACQDMRVVFAPVSEEEADAVRAAIRNALDGQS